MTEALKRGRAIKGALALVLVEPDTGTVSESAGFPEGMELGTEMAGAWPTSCASSGASPGRRAATRSLEEVLLTTSERYYIARGLGMGEEQFLLLVLDRHHGNLARAQLDLVSIERSLAVTNLGR